MKYRAYKYRLYPNEEQKVLIAKHLGSCRFIEVAKQLSNYACPRIH